jgi:cytochrome P450
MARLEGAVAFETLARRVPDLELVDEEPSWLPSLNLHGVSALPIRA